MRCGDCEYMWPELPGGRRGFYCDTLPLCPRVTRHTLCLDDLLRQASLVSDIAEHEGKIAELRAQLEDGGADDQA